MKWPRTLQMTRYFPGVENATASVRFIAPDNGNGPPSEKGGVAVGVPGNTRRMRNRRAPEVDGRGRRLTQAKERLAERSQALGLTFSLHGFALGKADLRTSSAAGLSSVRENRKRATAAGIPRLSRFHNSFRSRSRLNPIWVQTSYVMNHHSLLFWSPRLLALAVSVFFGLFALDAFAPGKSRADASDRLRGRGLDAVATVDIPGGGVAISPSDAVDPEAEARGAASSARVLRQEIARAEGKLANSGSCPRRTEAAVQAERTSSRGCESELEGLA